MFGGHFIPEVSFKITSTQNNLDHSPYSNSKAPFSDFMQRELSATADRQEQNLRCSLCLGNVQKADGSHLNPCREPTDLQGTTTTTGWAVM